VGHPEPLFLSRGVTLERVRRIGDGSHLAMRVATGGLGYPAVYFGQGKRFDELAAPGRWDAVYQLRLDDWRDQIRIKLMLKEVVPAATGAAAVSV
jgi:single-stranded DNA-specific DHH superfamily exonuclease